MNKNKIIPPTFKVKTNFPLWKRIYVLIKNPFTYIFFGYVEY